MSNKAAAVLACISIGLLVIYGADVISIQQDGQGFLPFDSKVRGFGLGMPSVVLPFISYFISRKTPSKAVGALIIISGILIAVGGSTVLATADAAELQQQGRNLIAESVPLIIIGAIITFLGSIKLKRS